MAQTVKLEISKDIFEIIKKLANRKKPEEYISELVIEKFRKS